MTVSVFISTNVSEVEAGFIRSCLLHLQRVHYICFRISGFWLNVALSFNISSNQHKQNHNKISENMDSSQDRCKTVCELRAGMDDLRGMQLLFSMRKLVHIPLRYSNKYLTYSIQNVTSFVLTNSPSYTARRSLSNISTRLKWGTQL